MNLAEVEDLEVSFGRKRDAVVRGVSFTIAPGECVGVVGESGSGKSVTARTLLGLAGPAAEVRARVLRVGGQDVTRFSDRDWQRIRGRLVGLVSQDALVSLDPLRQVGEEVAEPIRLHRTVPPPDRGRRVIEALAESGIPDPEVRSRQYPHQLSGGLRQRALVATAVAARPALIIADEPTTALDVIAQHQILRLLADLKAAGQGLLLISHDLAVVAALADRLIVMRDGVIVESGPTARVLSAPEHEYTAALCAAARHRRAAPPAVAPAGSGLLLDVRSVRKSFGGHRAVDGVSLTLGAGQTLGVVGESASGKSTVARMIMGLTRPDEGEVLLAGQPWSAASERSRRRRRPRIQLVHQDPYAAFDPRYTIGQSIGEALPGLARSVQRARVAEWLGRVGLDERLASRRPHQLSGGQRQRAAIARALAPQPELLICDEPVSALDASVRAQALDLLARLQRETGVAMLFISHDLGIVEQVSNQLIVMKGGTVVEEGTAADVFEQPRHPYTRELLAAIPRLPADLNQSPPSGGPTARVS